MTPKKKAFELLRKFSGLIGEKKQIMDNINLSKQCALIAVDEILKIVPSIYVTNDEELHSGHYQYWNEVKKEIEKL